MKTITSPHLARTAGGLALALALVSSATSARANVYATDIQANGALVTAAAPKGGTATITYRLNQAADLGVTVTILHGNTVVATIPGGTAMGLNTVTWHPTAYGTYAVNITAAATGFPIWTQISVDTNPGMPAHYPLGIDVDKNTNSPYYGRVVFGCAIHTGTANVPPAGMQTGLFKANADGSQGDEGWYGNAGYLADDGGDGAVAGQMPDSGGFDPMKIRIGDDDRIYWVDNSDFGAILASDMQATTNQVVAADGGNDTGPSITGMADWSDAHAGCQEFDITSVTTTNGALWLCDNDFPNWGVWMFHMTNNGAIDPNDTQGTQAVFAGSGSDLSLVSSGGCTIDTNLDIFVGQDRNNENAVYQSMMFSNWNAGVLPPENSGFNNSLLTSTWAYGCSLHTTCGTDPTYEGVRDVVVNSRTTPTIVAVPMTAGSQFASGSFAGIRLHDAMSGNIITANGGAQVLTNLDAGQQYACAAWDNVGNLYGGSTSRNVWRAWTPPGANTNTTLAVVQINVPSISITSTIVTPSGTPGCYSVTINFSSTPALPAGGFSLYGASAVSGPYTPVAGASIISTGVGTYQATAAVCSGAQYFEVQY